MDVKAVQNELILYCGTMFGISGAAAGVCLLSSQIAKTVLKKLPQKALTKTVWYPIVKQVGKAIGVKITKSTVDKGISKAVPVLGGVISGGLNFASMMPMSNRLAKTLDEANFDYTEEKVISHVYTVSSVLENDIQAEGNGQSETSEQIRQATSSLIANVEKPVQESVHIDPFEALEKLAKLYETGVLTKDEFKTKKEVD